MKLKMKKLLTRLCFCILHVLPQFSERVPGYILVRQAKIYKSSAAEKFRRAALIY